MQAPGPSAAVGRRGWGSVWLLSAIFTAIAIGAVMPLAALTPIAH